MLCDEYDIFFYWYNLNIYNEQEYKNRRESAVKYAEELNVPFYKKEILLYYGG
jgi:predicted adenine nucleotide alpha hydrolase (AANH) superfamily ATPase